MKVVVVVVDELILPLCIEAEVGPGGPLIHSFSFRAAINTKNTN